MLLYSQIKNRAKQPKSISLGITMRP